MNKNNDILLTFLLSNPDTRKSKIIEKIKKIECLFIDKYSSMENESINPVKPNESINIILTLSIELHQFLKYSIIILNHF